MNLTLVGTSRCDFPAREAAGGIVAPLNAARTAQRAIPTFRGSMREIFRGNLPMNRTPSSRPSPPVGEKVPGGRLRGIPTGSWLRFTSGFLEVFPPHEPFKIILL